MKSFQVDTLGELRNEANPSNKSLEKKMPDIRRRFQGDVLNPENVPKEFPEEIFVKSPGSGSIKVP